MNQYSLSETVKVVRSLTLPSGELDGELMALDVPRGEVFGLDPIGTTIWNLADEPIALGDIVDRLVQEFDGCRDTIQKDVFRFLSETIDAGLFEIAA